MKEDTSFAEAPKYIKSSGRTHTPKLLSISKMHTPNHCPNWKGHCFMSSHVQHQNPPKVEV